jgi:hypothetical protein
MSSGFATVHEDEGILVTSAEVNGFTLSGSAEAATCGLSVV